MFTPHPSVWHRGRCWAQTVQPRRGIREQLEYGSVDNIMAWVADKVRHEIQRCLLCSWSFCFLPCKVGRVIPSSLLCGVGLETWCLPGVCRMSWPWVRRARAREPWPCCCHGYGAFQSSGRMSTEVRGFPSSPGMSARWFLGELLRACPFQFSLSRGTLVSSVVALPCVGLPALHGPEMWPEMWLTQGGRGRDPRGDGQTTGASIRAH